MSLGYLALEVRRTLRAPGTLLFTIGFPAVFYLLEVVLYAGYELPAGAVGWPTILMVSMNAWGVLMAGLLVGSRVVHERAAGWQRQLRLTPLSGGGYLLGKAAVGQLVAAPTALAVPLVAVLVHGVQLDAAGWLHATLLLWVGGIPFALLGLLIGQLATTDNVQSLTTVGMLLLALFGGLFIPVDSVPGWWAAAARLAPSFWLAEIGRAGIVPGGSALTAAGVLAGWTGVLGAAVVWRYRRDSARA